MLFEISPDFVRNLGTPTLLAGQSLSAARKISITRISTLNLKTSPRQPLKLIVLLFSHTQHLREQISCDHRSTTKLTTLQKMKHLAAYLLLGLAGNTSPSASDIKGVLSSVGIDADDERLDKLISELEGKDINQV